jgi:hypothetical protein
MMNVVFQCHPEPAGRQVKDPSAFSNNQQSLLWMGFFVSLRMTVGTHCSTRDSFLPAEGGPVCRESGHQDDAKKMMIYF